MLLVLRVLVLPSHSLSPFLRPPPRSTLFPYTTLFRSLPVPPAGREDGPPGPGGRDHRGERGREPRDGGPRARGPPSRGDRKSTRLNSSHTVISYAVFCLKKKKKKKNTRASNLKSKYSS